MIGTELEMLYQLLIALGIGLLIGVERGWQNRDSEDGQRIAGIRTHGLIALLGGGLGMMTEEFGAVLFGLSFIAVALIIGAVFIMWQRQSGSWGITSLVATLLSFVLAALSITVDALMAASMAVITVILLSCKPILHSWVYHLKVEELKAAISLLLMSVVMLPLLPNEAIGPLQAFNPYKIWLMVIIIAAMSFLGYFAVKLGGAQKGILFTGLFGGLASSTAVTLHLSKLARQQAELAPIIASGILVACVTMYFRVLVIVGILAPKMLSALWLPMLVMAVVTSLPVGFYQRNGQHSFGTDAVLKNPLELKAAVIFGVILTLVMLLSALLRQWFGDAGLLTLAAVTGIAKMDAIILSLAEQSNADLSIGLFVSCCVIAAATSSCFKAAMSTTIGGRPLLITVALPLIISASVGIGVVWVLYG